MAFEFGAVLHLGFLRIPDAQSTVGGASGNEITSGVPGNCANPGELGRWSEARSLPVGERALHRN